MMCESNSVNCIAINSRAMIFLPLLLLWFAIFQVHTHISERTNVCLVAPLTPQTAIVNSDMVKIDHFISIVENFHKLNGFDLKNKQLNATSRIYNRLSRRLKLTSRHFWCVRVRANNLKQSVCVDVYNQINPISIGLGKTKSKQMKKKEKKNITK